MSLTNSKVGERLLVTANGYRSIFAVTHVTKLQVHAGGMKFNREGRQMGADRHYRSYARPLTQEDLDEIKDQRLRVKLIGKIEDYCRRSQLRELTTQQLATLYKLCKSVSPDKPTA